jgi:hypothetical protein
MYLQKYVVPGVRRQKEKGELWRNMIDGQA